MPHPNPRVAIPVAVGLVLVLAIGGYFLLRAPSAPGPQITPLVINSSAPTPTPSGATATPTPTPTATPPTPVLSYSQVLGGSTATFQYPTTWSSPTSSRFLIFDAKAVADGTQADLKYGAKMQTYLVSQIEDLPTAASNDEAANTLVTRSDLSAGPYGILQYDVMSPAHVHMVTTYYKLETSAPVIAIQLAIGSVSDQDSVLRQSYLDTYHTLINSFSMTAAQ